MIKIKYFLLFLVFVLYGFSQQNTNDIELTADQLYQEGIKLYQKGEYEKAINYLEKASQKKANFGESYYYIGLCYIELLDEDKAKQFLGIAKYLVEDEKLKTEINEKLKNLHTEIETRKNYKKIKEKYQNALTLYDQGEYEKAYYELEKILKEEQIQKDENFKTQIKSKIKEIIEKLQEQAREEERKRKEEQKRREEEKRRKEEEREKEMAIKFIKLREWYMEGVFKPGSSPDGFRGIKWGTDISNFPGNLIYMGSHSKYGVNVYVKKDEELKIDNVAVEKILYCFWGGKFCGVIIYLSGCDNWISLKNAFFEKFGENYSSPPRLSEIKKEEIQQYGVITFMDGTECYNWFYDKNYFYYPLYGSVTWIVMLYNEREKMGMVKMWSTEILDLIGKGGRYNAPGTRKHFQDFLFFP